jgi:genome maintenance exonuclease 1
MFLQLAAYASAHNKVYNTKITQGVILMCTPDNFFQRFIVDGQEFIDYQEAFHEKVDQYYRDRSQNKDEKREENK